MVVVQGDKVHVITRRLFQTDLRRHFAGVVEEVSGSLIRVRGYAFIFDDLSNEFVRREEERVRVLSVAESGLIVNLLPRETDLEKVRYETGRNGQRVVTDGAKMALEVSEFGLRR